MEMTIRRAQKGDEGTLAHIQTESWKSAFAGILTDEILSACTDVTRVTDMYRQILCENTANIYLLSIHGKPHCMAAWGAARDDEHAGKAELICIHSLPADRRKGYGSLMMDRVLKDAKAAGYSEVVLWVFRDNAGARAFYESKGFRSAGVEKPSFTTVEVLYSVRI